MINISMNYLYVQPQQETGKLHYSQYDQDRYAIDKIFLRKKKGYFLDIGARDGINSSNSYLMEKYYDWNGICFECDPRETAKLRNNRFCHVVTSPVYNKTGNIINFEIHRIGGLSGIGEHLCHEYRNKLSPVIQMTTISLMDCLKYFDCPTLIDYVSLDTEGSEYEILSTVDFDKYKFNYFAIEHNNQHPKRENIKALLESKGYKLHRSHHEDDDYIRCEYASSIGL